MYFKIDRHRHSPASNRNNSSSSSTHSFQTLPEYSAYLNSDTDILDSSSSNHSPSAPYSPDRATVTPNNTHILQTQTSVITTQSQNTTTTQLQNTQQNLPFLETNSPTSDSCDESLTTQNNVQETSNILNRPPLPPIPTTRTPHIPDPSSILQYVHSCPHGIPTATKTPRKTSIPILSKNLALPSTSKSPIKTIPEHTVNPPSELSSFTFSQIYPRLELDCLQSSTTSSLTDLYYKDKDSDSNASTRVPRHSYNLRSQPRRNSRELQSFTSSSTNSRLVRQQAQPRSETPSFSSSHPTIPSSLSIPFQVTSGFETASLLSEDPQIISDNAANFSRVYSPSSILSDSSIQLPEYFLEDYSRPPTPNPHEHPVRVNSKIIHSLNEDPRYTVLPERFINNSSLSIQETKENYEDYKKFN